MGVKAVQITVATTGETALIQPGTTSTTFSNVSGAVGDELPILIKNTDATNNIYLGGQGVTSSTGFQLAGGATFNAKFIGSDATDVFAVATGAPVVVCVFAGRQ